MRRVPPYLVLLLAAAACTKAAESNSGGGDAGGATASKGAGGKGGVGSAEMIGTGGGTDTEGSADPEGEADGGGSVAVPTGAGSGTAKGSGKKSKKIPKGPGGAAAVKTSWEIVEGGGKTEKRHGPDDTFNLAIDAAESTAVGSEVSFKLTVTPGSAWKINYCEPGEEDCNDYPVKLTLEAPEGIEVAKDTLKSGDLSHVDKASLVMEFKAKPTAAGTHTIPARFKFAVCQDRTCFPRRLDMWFVVAAK